MLQVYHVFPHIDHLFYKVLIGVLTFTSLATYLITNKSPPSRLINYNKDPRNLLSLLKRFNADEICPTCEIVQPVGTKHCTACNVCVIDYDSHSSLVDNCITASNRMQYLVFLSSMICFLILMVIVSVAHFNTPTIEELNRLRVGDFIDVSEEAILGELDSDTSYKMCILTIFTIAITMLAPILCILKSECDKYGSISGDIFMESELYR